MYTHSEQLFIDARGGTVPNAAEWVEIKALLAAMVKAGFPVDDQTSLPFISIMAFFYARAPKHIDIDLLVGEAMEALVQRQDKLIEELRLSLENAQKPVINLDVIATFKESMKGAMKEVISLTAIFTAVLMIGLAAFGGWQIHALLARATAHAG